MNFSDHSILTLTVDRYDAAGVRITVCSPDNEDILEYYPDKRFLYYLSDGPVSVILRSNEQQFRKVLNARAHETFTPGESLSFVIVKDRNTDSFTDRSRIVAIDRRDGVYTINIIKDEKTSIPCLYVDGSYMPCDDSAAIAAVLENPEGDLLLYSEPVHERNSNLIEMVSVIRGLEKLPTGKKLRIVSDSMYVHKGLAEWIINWKLNEWCTASGRKVKHIDYWTRLDELTSDRYIEMQWIRKNSGNHLHSLCDRTARRTAIDGVGGYSIPPGEETSPEAPR